MGRWNLEHIISDRVLSTPVIPYPVIACSGSKYSVSTQVKEYFPRDFNTYYEPMIGGAGIFLSLQHNPSVIGDKNKWLMDTYWAIKHNYNSVAEILSSLVPTREVYERIRRINYLNVPVEHRAAHLIFLNHLCFGRIFRLGKGGRFNVPFGKPVKFITSTENLRAISESLLCTRLEYGDFTETVKNATSKDFVLFDPPSPESRVFGYSRIKGKDPYEFTDKDYHRLLETCLDLDGRGVRWALLDNNTSLVRMLFKSYSITPLSLSKKDGEVMSVLIYNYALNT